MSNGSDPHEWSKRCTGEACVICQQGRPLDVIAELEVSWVTMGEHATMPGNCCLFYRGHVVELHDLPPEEAAAFMRDVQRLSRAIQSSTGAVKMNYEVHGNTIPHLHMHFYPRYVGDPFEQAPINPRLVSGPVYAPGTFEVLKQRVLSELAAQESDGPQRVDSQGPYRADLLPQRCARSLRVLAGELALKQMPPPTTMPVTLAQVVALYEDHERGILLRQWNLPQEDEQAIYRISVPNPEALRQYVTARESIDQARRTEWKLARFNGLAQGSTTLYVGVSSDLAKRLEWHFGVKTVLGFGMQLLRWVPQEIHAIEMTLEYWKTEALGLAHPLAAQALEDEMWKECKPLFGRQGAR